MANATITRSVVINGNGTTVTRTGADYVAETELAGGVTIPVAQAATVTTRTDANTGVVTTTATLAITITTAYLADLYWSGGRRRNMTVTNVTGNAITLDGGTGDDLPALSTAVNVAAQVEITVPLVTMADVVAITAEIIGTTEACQVSVGVESAGYTEGDYLLLNNPTTTGHVFGSQFNWASLWSETNELASATTFNTIRVTTNDTANATTFKMNAGTA